ncbi:TapB family protein [Flagellimonas beolgyonensis]|uniref:TapB family protein n=1 Tax=Flagellimonas beolgyonensis TaxID=864064 RepID=UPI003D651CE1
MKKYVLLVFIAFFALNLSVAQSSCSEYYPLVDGATFQYTSYDKKGKEEGQINYMVTNVSSSGDQVSATMAMEIADQKGNTYNSSYDIHCDGNVVKIDFKSLMNEQMLNQFQDMEVDISGTDVELPNNLSVGQELPDGNVSIKMKMGGAINMNMNVETINRKVEKKEQVTTPAGTFDCVVIYSETKSKMMMTNQTMPSRVWLAAGVGMVKQESYNKSGKLMGSSVLTQFSK